jgi:hypothetical protein
LAAAAIGLTLAAPEAVARTAPAAAPPAAQPFAAAAANALDRSRAVKCLTYAVYYEAGNQSAEGQRAVAQVVLNRVRNPAFPRTVCGVVFQGAHAKGCQFTFACDGSMARRPEAAAWKRAEAVAEEALGGEVMAQVGEATYYHADYVAPNWSNLSKTAKVGVHIFYSRPATAIQLSYDGGEPLIDVKKLMVSAWTAPEPELDLDQLMDVEPHMAAEPHAPADIGGRIQLGHGWAPAAAAPSDDAMSRILAAQGG